MKISLKKLLAKILEALETLCVKSSGVATITFTTGALETTVGYWRRGNMVQMYGLIKCTNSIASGSNLAQGTIKGIPKPIGYTQTVTFYGNNAVVSALSQSGAFTSRNCGDDTLASGSDAALRFVYITDGTML